MPKLPSTSLRAALASAIALAVWITPRPMLNAQAAAAQTTAAHAAPAQPTTGPTVRAAPGSPIAGIDAYVARGMREWRVPGLAIGVVRDDSIVLLRGYGVRTAGRPEPVDPRTLFAIASTSKAFTGMLLAMLADSGKLRWDDQVQRYLPYLQLADPYVSRELTIRDLLTHRAGLARADLLWTGGYPYSDSTEVLLRRLRYLRPSWSLRTHYGYNNLMYAAAGEVIRTASGMPWDRFIRERIFQPLGMTCSNTSIHSLPGLANVATPHAIVDDTLRAVPYTDADGIGPAGAINSCAADMVRWVKFQLDSARAGSRRLVSPRNFRETHTPQLALRIDSAYRALNPATHLRSYAFGWIASDYHGREMLSHAGNLSGMNAMVGLLPEERLGVVVLSNLEGQSLREALMYWVFDRYLGVPLKDWSAATLAGKVRADSARSRARREREGKRVLGTHPSLPLARYAGTYSDSLYGPAKVTLENGRLVFTLAPRAVGDMQHWQYDTFRVVWRDHRDGVGYVTFMLDPWTGAPTTLHVDADPGEPVEEVPVYERVP